MRHGTFAVSWGRYGGFYLHPKRICLGWIAATYVPVEIDDLMRAYAERSTPAEDGESNQRRTERSVFSQ